MGHQALLEYSPVLNCYAHIAHTHSQSEHRIPIVRSYNMDAVLP